MSLKKFGEVLTSRFDEPIHEQWSNQAQAAIVILWGLLVYPQLDQEITYKDAKVGKFIDLFQGYTDEIDPNESVEEILELLVQTDYIRLDHRGYLQAGTQLFSAVHAASMYRFFRSSVVARKMNQILHKTSTS